ncbi:Mammalian cell entry like domain-containing protein [Candidatus Magnetoovum chiemensis]|nr:Mammalian cell entry like domain-containing protein [Candidatus Magnetoovum chiemensis]
MKTRKFDVEFYVGVFLLLGFLSVVYLAVNLGDVQLFGEKGYVVYADFFSTGGMLEGAPVEIAGVNVGRVREISLDDKTYQAKVALVLDPSIKIGEDSIASVKTKGLLGEKYIQISPGGSDVTVRAGSNILETESSIDMEQLISKYAFGDVK